MTECQLRRLDVADSEKKRKLLIAGGIVAVEKKRLDVAEVNFGQNSM